MVVSKVLKLLRDSLGAHEISRSQGGFVGEIAKRLQRKNRALQRDCKEKTLISRLNTGFDGIPYQQYAERLQRKTARCREITKMGIRSKETPDIVVNLKAQEAKGYYSIIQYVPDIERAEGANIGIVLFCPDKHFLGVKLSRDNKRIIRFFGSKPDSDLNLARINILKMAFQERVFFEEKLIQTQEDFRAFTASRGNQLLLTEPRPIKVYSTWEDLLQLFNRLVGDG